MERLLCGLQHLCDQTPGVIFHAAAAAARLTYDRDKNSAGGGESMKYRGYDRIHDDNKAEGRPVGNQWTDADHYYENGIKIYR